MYRLMPFTRRALIAAAALSVLHAASDTAAQEGCTAGETTVRVGDPRLARYTPIAVDSLDMVVEREGASRAFGSYAQHVHRVTENGAAALLFVQRGSTPRGIGVDSIWVDARTWAPLRHVANTPGSTMNVSYRDGHVTGRVTEGDSVKTVDAEVPPGMFDYSVASQAVKSLPMCAGAVIRVSGYDAAHGPRETVYQILRAEQVEIGGAPRDVWTADVQVGDRTVRMHIDRATGRELDWSFSGPNGAVLRGVSQIFNTR
ncbi:MAG TPA: hypothetical protein VFS20_20950 [Longimicrobium sp.]|nr:hypothetical protein [Longimicrobium sp.]